MDARLTLTSITLFIFSYFHFKHVQIDSRWQIMSTNKEPRNNIYGGEIDELDVGLCSLAFE
jgi:hypothetical protein